MALDTLRLFDDLTHLLRTYTRAFVSQGVGIIGLVWCLAGGHAGLAIGLTVLVLADQALSLRSRAASASSRPAIRRVLDGWCIALAVVDVLICLGAVMHSLGLHEVPGGPMTTSPLDGLAYVVAMLAHAPTALAPATAAGRLLGAVLAAIGVLAFLGGLAAVLRLRPIDTRSQSGPSR